LLNQKILLAHNHYRNAGGEDTVFATESALLEGHGHSVIRYAVRNDALKSLNPFQVAGKAIWNSETYHEIRKLIRRYAIDILHVHNTWFVLSPSIYAAAQEEGIAVVQTLHNYRLLCPSSTHFYREGKICEDCLKKRYPFPGIRHACYRHSRMQTAVLASTLSFHHWRKTWTRHVDMYIALTEFGRQKFVQGGLPREKIVVKPNGAYPDPGVREKDEKGQYVLFAGRISREKGILTLLEAWKPLNEIPLKILGEGALTPKIHATLRTFPNMPVEICGQRPREEVLRMMKKARFLVFPSEWYEGFPMLLVEAFASATPVIASRLGAMAEIVTDGETGMHFTAGDSEDLRNKVLWAWEHASEMQEMGWNARREYEKKYTAEKNYQRLMEIYRLAQKRAKES